MKGSLVWTDDSHAGQGNGEIDLTAIKLAFKEFNITIDVIKQKTLACHVLKPQPLGFQLDMIKT
jgi:acetamidase/formamidase